MRLRISGIVNDSICDGPELRLVVFTQGCPHHCSGCHNPDTWNADGGREMEIDDIISMIMSNPLLGGVTISGGEPFAQSETVYEMCRMIKKLDIEIAVYTGYTYEEIVDNDIMSVIDVLIDGRYDENLRSLELNYRGSSNQRIIDVKRSRDSGEVVLMRDNRWE